MYGKVRKVKVKKSFRLVSKNASKNKVDLIYSLFDLVLALKLSMSDFIYNNVNILFETKSLGEWTEETYLSWWNESLLLPKETVKHLFEQICKLYLIHIQQLIRKNLYEGRDNISAIANYVLVKSGLIFYKSINEIENVVKKDNVYYQKWKKLSYSNKNVVKSFVNSSLRNVRNQVKKIEFRNGTFSLVNVNKSFDLVVDRNNKKFNVFLRLKLNEKEIYLPVLIELNAKRKSKKYFDEILNGGFDSSIRLVDRRNQTKKLMFVITKDVVLKLKPVRKVVALDFNVRPEKFIVCSNGNKVCLNKKIVSDFLSFMEKVDKTGLKDLSKTDKKHISKRMKAFYWYLQLKLSFLLRKLEREGYTDIVIENTRNFVKFTQKVNIYGHQFSVSRLVRLFKILGLKYLLVQMAHNRGIRVHFTNPIYSSQMCVNCGNIDIKSRISLSKFKCSRCGFELDADLLASLNILLRCVYLPFAFKFHKINEFGEFRPKYVPKEKLFSILQNSFDRKQVLSCLERWADVLPELRSFSSSGFSTKNQM